MKNFINKIGIIFFMALVFGVFSCGSVYAATVGQQLLQPETDWTRLDDANTDINYTGSWQLDVGGSQFYANNEHRTIYNNASSNGSKVTFNIIGIKFRVIGALSTTCSTNIEVIIDGNSVGSFSQQRSSVTTQALTYESDILTNGFHTVEIINRTTNYLAIDAIDVQSPVQVIATGISLNKKSESLIVGETDNLIATITPENTTNKKIVWESKNPNVATVDQTGKVTGVTSGSAIIVAKIEGTDVTASCTVNVKEIESGRAILNVTMTNGTIKEYDLSMTEINDFINWYNGRAEGKGTISYCIKKNTNIKPFNNRKEYLVFDKIYSFEVNEYDNK